MINRVIEFSLRNRFLIVAVYIGLAVAGYWAMMHTPIDAIPDLSENQVIVFADWPGRSPQEVEAQITQPLSLGLQGLAGVKTVRASSMFGFSLLTIVFEDRVAQDLARQRVFERIDFLARKVPPG